MLGIHCVGVGVDECQSEDPFCLFWRETHTRLEEYNGRKVPERTKEGREQSSGQPTARMCGPRGRVGQCERMSQHSW